MLANNSLATTPGAFITVIMSDLRFICVLYAYSTYSSLGFHWRYLQDVAKLWDNSIDTDTIIESTPRSMLAAGSE